MENFTLDPASLNAVDALLVLVVLLGAWAGWRRGFMLSVLELVALAAAVLAAFLGYRYTAAWIAAQWPALGVWTAPLSFVGTFVLTHLLLAALASRLVRGVPARAHAHAVNRVLGIAPGLVNGGIHAVVVAVLLLTVPLFDGLSRMAREGALAGQLAAPAEWVEARLAPIFDPAVRRTLQAITVPPQSRTSVALPFKVADAKSRPDLEARMLELVNAERARQGLRLLKPDPELAEVARAHSRDMLARGYFSHVSPEGRDLADRIRQAELRYIAAGENLAFAQTLPVAHQGLMKSPGHRANILQPRFARLGVAVLDGGRYGLMVTQNFRN